MDGIERHKIIHQPWQKYNTTSTAGFAIAHTGKSILIKFYVEEKQLNAVSRPPNDAVHKDNCVEFFLSVDNNATYYNMEFNCLGSAKIAYGAGKAGRKFLTPQLIEKIGRHLSLDVEQTISHNKFRWTMLLDIPVSIFTVNGINNFTGLKAKGNFHKCGDDLTEPHYLTWNNINTAEPDFHQPAFFGNLIFE